MLDHSHEVSRHIFEVGTNLTENPLLFLTSQIYLLSIICGPYISIHSVELHMWLYWRFGKRCHMPFSQIIWKCTITWSWHASPSSGIVYIESRAFIGRCACGFLLFYNLSQRIVCISIYIYIYIYRERERERERDLGKGATCPSHK